MKSVIFALISLAGIHAQAQEEPTSQTSVQFFYQPLARQHAITPQYRVTSTDTTLVNTDGRLLSQQHVLTLNYAYGLLDNLSVGASAGYSYLVRTNKLNKASDERHVMDLTEPTLNIKGFFTLSSQFRLRYGLEGRYSLPGKFDSTSQPENTMDGRTEVTPYLGFDYTSGSLSTGMKAEHAFLIGDQLTEVNGSEVKIEGAEATTLSFFLEDRKDQGVLGFSLGYTYFYGDLSRVFVGRTRFASSLAHLSIYSVFSLNERIQLLPIFRYAADFAEDRISRGVKGTGMIEGSLGLRIEI